MITHPPAYPTSNPTSKPTSKPAQKPYALDHEQLDQLQNSGYVIIDSWLSTGQLTQLRAEALERIGDFEAAKVDSGLHAKTRSDQIYWIDHQKQGATKLPQAAELLNHFENLATTLNQSFYAGVRWIEAHYAHYASTNFYARHRDNPKRANNRVFSAVYYLHEHWETGYGGELRIWTDQLLSSSSNDTNAQRQPPTSSNKQTALSEVPVPATVDIFPLPNRLVLFDSNLEHEVVLANFNRLSVAAWFRRDEAAA